MVILFLTRHYIIPNNSWCLQNTLIPQQQIWINISSLLFMAIRLPLLSGRNLRTGQLRLLPIGFRRLLDGHGRDYESKLPHGRTGAPLKENMKEGARIHKNSRLFNRRNSTFRINKFVILIHIYIHKFVLSRCNRGSFR
jgi:hypothetical protein